MTTIVSVKYGLNARYQFTLGAPP